MFLTAVLYFSVNPFRLSLAQIFYRKITCGGTLPPWAAFFLWQIPACPLFSKYSGFLCRIYNSPQDGGSSLLSVESELTVQIMKHPQERAKHCCKCLWMKVPKSHQTVGCLCLRNLIRSVVLLWELLEIEKVFEEAKVCFLTTLKAIPTQRVQSKTCNSANNLLYGLKTKANS